MPNSKVAILIDGGFFVQRFKQINVTKNCPTRENVEALITDIIKQVQTKTGSHSTDTLLRTFYYDCQPFAKTIKNIQGKSIDFSLSAVYATQMAYLNSSKWQVSHFTIQNSLFIIQYSKGLFQQFTRLQPRMLLKRRREM